MQMEILHKLFYMFSFKIHKKHCKLVVLLVGFSFLICARCLICVNDNSILRKTSSPKTGLNWTGIIIVTSASVCVCVCTPLPSFLMHTELSCSVYTLSAHWITDAVNALPCYRFTLFFCTRLNKYSLYKYGYCNIYLTYDVQAVLFPIHHMKLQNTVYDGRCKSPYNKKNQIKRHVHDNHEAFFGNKQLSKLLVQVECNTAACGRHWTKLRHKTNTPRYIEINQHVSVQLLFITQKYALTW